MILRNRSALALFLILLAAHAAFAFHAKPIKSAWANVPPVPSARGMTAFALGDRLFAYRTAGLMLQNLGNTGGRAVALEEYDYDALGRWFFLADRMDPRADFVPYLAAYYFGATQNPDQLGPVIDYLSVVGRRPEEGKGGKWRWLAQAVYLARFRQNDFDRALALSKDLSDLWQPGRPAWMRTMPVLVMTAEGARAGAYDMTMAILKEDAAKMDPAEVRATVAYLCERILTADEARQNPLCADNP